MDLQRRQVDGNTVQQSQDFIDERLCLSRLLHHEMPPAFLRDLNKRVASHVLNTFVCFMHELKELVDHGFEEFPVRFEESRILSNDIHDIRGYDCFVVLASFHFHKTQKLLDDGYKEALLRLLICPRSAICISRS